MRQNTETPDRTASSHFAEHELLAFFEDLAHRRHRDGSELESGEYEFGGDGCSDDETRHFLIAGLQRLRLDPITKARALRALARIERERLVDLLDGREVDDFREHLAKVLHGCMSGRTIARYLRLLDLPQQIQEAVAEGCVKMAAALKVASLTKRQQAEIAARVGQGELPAQVIADYLAKGQVPEIPADEGQETPAGAYRDFCDFLADWLPDLEEHADALAGTAGSHQGIAELMERTAAFCSTMSGFEVAAHEAAIEEWRGVVETV